MTEESELHRQYRGMTPQQLDAEFHQVVGFILRIPDGFVDRGKEGKTVVVDMNEADRRARQETFTILQRRLDVLLDYAKITPNVRGRISRDFGLFYMVGGVVGTDRERFNLLLVSDGGGIFNPLQAREIERGWYHSIYSDVLFAINFLEDIEDQSWRLEGMKQWNREFLKYHEAEP